MGEIINNHTEKHPRPSIIMSEDNYNGYLLDALSPNDSNIRIYNLKKMGTIVRKNGDNIRTNIEYDEGYCCIEVISFGETIIFKGNNIDDTWDNYNKWCNSSYKYTLYIAPDGRKGSYTFFKKEALKGRFHECKIGILNNK